MATIRKRGKRWEARIRRAGHSASSTFRTRREAQVWAANAERDIEERRTGCLSPSHRPFGEALERYQEEVSRKKDGGRWECVRINKLLGKPTKRQPQRDPDPLTRVPLSRIGPEHFADWRDRRSREVSDASVLREWNLLSAVCSKAAKEWRWLPNNPLSQVTRPKAPAPRTRRVTDQEIKQILKSAGYRQDQPPATVSQRIALAFLFALETAMRAGEICALRPDDVDLKKRVAHVRAEEVGARKTGHPRTVPLSKKAIALVRQAQAQAAKIKDNRLFGLKAQNLSAMFGKIRKKAGIDDLHFHDTRAEALTRLSRKLNVMQLARVSGHRDMKQLLNTYYREDPATLADLLD